MLVDFMFLCLAVPTLVEPVPSLLVDGMSHLLVRTGRWYHWHEKFCHVRTSISVFFGFAFVNVRRQVLQECCAFALLLLVVIDVNVATATSIYLYIHCCRNFCRSIIFLFQQV